MSSEAITLAIPASLAQELHSASQQFLTELLERGLRGPKIERALERYAQGGECLSARLQTKLAYHNRGCPGTPTLVAWNRAIAQSQWQKK